MDKYFGSFSDADQMKKQFDYKGLDFPTDEQILFAAYEGGDYEGAALVIYEKDGKLYEVNGSHCSCYGLEDQWSPEDTSWEALKDRKLNSYDYTDPTIEAFKQLVETHLKENVGGD